MLSYALFVLNIYMFLSYKIVYDIYILLYYYLNIIQLIQSYNGTHISIVIK
eukprot:SAG31_NODE_1928_length_6883_cov_6.045106_2_plen_51_part_00